jgi:hypothetical protein
LGTLVEETEAVMGGGADVDVAGGGKLAGGAEGGKLVGGAGCVCCENGG